MKTILSKFDTYMLDTDFTEALQELFRLSDVAQQNGSKKSSERTQFKYGEALRRCDDLKDVFALVQTCVKEYMNQERNDMVMQLVDLPLHVGAAHPVGTNRIVLNEALLDTVIQNRSFSEARAFVFSILLHEYIHCLGYLNEYDTRELVLSVSRNTFGPNHVVTHLAEYGPWHIFRRNEATT